MEFEQIDTTGCRIVGALTRLGRLGPKHHGIVLGRSTADGQTYVAESTREAGYRLTTYDRFVAAYSRYGAVSVQANRGKFSDIAVAQRALDELMVGGDGAYNLISNNCESFSNRAMNDHSISSQVLHTAAGVVVFIGALLVRRYTRRT